ncbi:MAG: hypothetical protein JNM16_11210 [Dechloromonas sp.]|nr:hypothetical protein [Dechloromonas sp.]
MLARKKNPLAAEISLIGEGGSPEIFIGLADFRVLHQESGLISGALLDRAGKRIGKVEIDGFPLGELSIPKGAGRPHSGDKHLAVMLAWAQTVGELGGKRKAGAADKETAKRFAYLTKDGEANGKTVRDIRAKQAKKHGIDLDRDIAHVIDNAASGKGPPACSIFIEKPTIYDTPGGGLEILGATAIAWAQEMGARVARLPSIRITIDEFQPGEGMTAWKSSRGPKIISIIRPGR